MPRERVRPKQKRKTPYFDIILNKGINEALAVTTPPPDRFLEMHNFRVSKGGDRIEKRDGLTEVTGDGTQFGAKDIYGYTTYRDANDDFCQITITDTAIWRKIGAASWASIHTWASTLAHPVKIFEIQNKIIIITEIDNVIILSDGTVIDGIGISAPTTLPTMALSYDAAIIEEDCAGIGDWADIDGGAGASTQVTYDSKSCFRFLNTGGAGDVAGRSIYNPNLKYSAKFAVETSVYINTIGSAFADDGLWFTHFTGSEVVGIGIDADELWIVDGATLPEDCNPTGIKISQDVWVDIKYYFNGSDRDNKKLELWIDGEHKGEFRVTNSNATLKGWNGLQVYGVTAATDVYMDYYNLSDVGSAVLRGKHRYAVTYARSGNHGTESNPIKSIVGSATRIGAGLDDLTSGGTFTGSKDMDIRVQIDGTGTPDTCKISYDGGTTWHTTDLALSTTMYLNYGIELTWVATTGHTDTNYWDFTCDALAINAVYQKNTFSSIPTSGDSQVDQRKIYRTAEGGIDYYLLTTINDNTTTAFVDNIADAALGAALEEDHDIVPNGKYPVWFDDRMWVGDEDENIIYYSKDNKPEEFNLSGHGARYVSVRGGKAGDLLTNMIEYSGLLYAFKQLKVFYIRRRLDGTYGRYEARGVNGNIAPWSLLEVFGLLMYYSYRGWEVFDGQNSYPMRFTRPIGTTLSTIDKTTLDLITSVHSPKTGEVWLSLPDRTGGDDAVTAVLNYEEIAFYTFGFHKIPSCLVMAQDSDKDIQVYLATRDGYVFTANSGDQDGSTNISAHARIPQVKFSESQLFDYCEAEYELPTGYTFTLAFYMNLEGAARLTKNLAGNTPATSTDRSLRLPIKGEFGMDVKGKHLGLEISNSEAVGSDLKINAIRVFHHTKERVREITGD